MDVKDRYDCLEWNVYYYDFNKNTIRALNIFKNKRFRNEIFLTMEDYSKRVFTILNKRTIEKCIKERNDKQLVYKIHDAKYTMQEKIRNTLFYYYGSKTEYEVVIKPWVGDDNASIKVDIYSQVMLNFDEFIWYLIEHTPDYK